MSFKKIQNYIAIFVFMAVLVVPTVVWFAFSLDKTLDFDLGEKRNKATLSDTITLENITMEYEKYYNDRIPFRSVIIKNKTAFDAFIEGPYNDLERGILHIVNRVKRFAIKSRGEEVDGQLRAYMDDAVDVFYDHGLIKSEIDPYDEYVKYPLKYSENNKVVIGQSGWLFLNDLNMPLYRGKEIIEGEKLAEYKKCLQDLQDACDRVGKKLVFLICPEKEEIYPEYVPYMEVENEVERAIHLRDYLATASEFKYLYPKENLFAAKKKYLVYKKYDSHWNDIGAYIGAKSVLDALGMPTKPIREYFVKKVDMKDYDLIYYGNFNLESQKRSFDYEVVFKPEIRVTTEFLPGTDQVTSIKAKSECNNNQKLFLIGDSYSYAMIQYFYKEFKESVFVGFKDLADGTVYDTGINQGIKDADVIVIELVERNDTVVMPYFCTKIKLILKSLYGF